MGYKYNGGTARSVGFEYQTNRPGDERDIVETFDDLLTVQNAYRLIEIKVDDEGGTKYIWNGLNQSDPNNWTVVGGGEKGADGLDGATGATGPAGPQGVQGIQGVKGDTGDTGTIGPKGDTGDTGASGADGSSIVVEGTDTVVNILAKDPTTPNLLWIASDSGTDGLGAPVVPGDGLVSDGVEWINAGPIRGPQGEKGDVGDTGASGADGADGLDGAQGIQGDTGVQGPTGPTGLTGDKGDKGDTGEGIAIGGTAGQLLTKRTSTNYDTEWTDDVSVKSTDVSLMVEVTQAEYDALTPDANTFYIING